MGTAKSVQNRRLCARRLSGSITWSRSREGQIIDIRDSTGTVQGPQIKAHAYAIQRRRQMEICVVRDLLYCDKERPAAA